MLISVTNLIGCPILSLHVGGTIARVTEAIVDPNELKIIAYRVEMLTADGEQGDILPVESIREFSQIGMIVDSSDEFVEGEEIIRIKTVLNLNFALTGLKVESKSGKKLGKVSDFNVEPATWTVQQIVVQRPLIKSFLDPELLISRNEIDSVTDHKVVVKDETSKASNVVASTAASSSFVNPFRERKLAAEGHAKDQRATNSN